MSNRVVQLGRAAGFEVWVTKSQRQRGEIWPSGSERIERSESNEALPRKVQAIVDKYRARVMGAFDGIGCPRWDHRNHGPDDWPGSQIGAASMLGDQITVCGSIMGTLRDMKRMMTFIVSAGIKPEIGEVLPMERALEAFRKMWRGELMERLVFTRQRS